MSNTTAYRDFRFRDMVSGGVIIKDDAFEEDFPSLAAYVRKIRVYRDGTVRAQVRSLRGNHSRVFAGRLRRLTDSSWVMGDGEMFIRDGILYLAAVNQLCAGRYIPREAWAEECREVREDA